MNRYVALPLAAIVAMTLVISNGSGSAASENDPFDALRHYRYGDNRAILETVQQRLNETFGDAAARGEAESRLIDVLQSDATQDAKEFVCAQLGIMGTPRAVPALATLLGHVELAFAARAALERIPAPEAVDALLDALPSATEVQRMGLIASIASHRKQGTPHSFVECPDNPMLPDDYTIVAHLNCGVQARTSLPDGPRLELLDGEPWMFKDTSGPLTTVAFHSDRVVYRAAGLKPDRRYVLGFTWWDVDAGGRVQSISFQSSAESELVMALPPSPVAAYNHGRPTWARCLLPVPDELFHDGSFRVNFKREAGPNAVVNEIWLLEAPEEDGRKHVLIITGDDYPGHVWRETAPALARALRKDKRLAVSISEVCAMVGSPLLSRYDAVVVHFKNYPERTPLPAECGENLTDYVESGGGLVLTHFGCGAFHEWGGYEKLAGRVWNPSLRPHDPYGAFEVKITGTDHPVTRGMAAFTVTDELYTCLEGTAPVEVLCEAVSKVDSKRYPIAFVVPGHEGRVFHCALGHDPRVYANPSAAALVRRGTAWATGL